MERADIWPEQFEDNLEAPKLKLTAERLAALDKTSTLPPEYPGLDGAAPERGAPLS